MLWLASVWRDEDRRDDALARLAERVYRDDPDARSLTDTEIKYLAAAAHGLDWRETASVYGVSPETVRAGLKRSRRVLAAKTTTHAVAIAFRQGLIE